MYTCDNLGLSCYNQLTMEGLINGKAGYFGVRIVELILTLFVVSFFTFAAFSIIPGDTARVVLGPNATEAQVENYRKQTGLDKPVAERYGDWIRGAVTGDLGKSVSFRKPVSELISSRLPVTLGMSAIALIMVIVISYPAAMLSSRRPGHALDHILSVFGHVIFAIPPFVLSLLMIVLFANLFGFISIGRYAAPSEDFAQFLSCMLLPSLCIALPKIAMTFKFLRASMIEERASGYVKTAKSHGLSDARIMVRHVLPNSSVSTITVISLVLSDILGGSLIVEQVFNLPGLGRLLLRAISVRDFPLLSGMVLYLAVITVVLYFIADIAAAMIDPRQRLSERARP